MLQTLVVTLEVVLHLQLIIPGIYIMIYYESIIVHFLPSITHMSILSVPLNYLSIYYSRFLTIPKSMIGIYDPTTIRNGKQLVGFQKEAFAKIGFHLVVFFISLYL